MFNGESCNSDLIGNGQVSATDQLHEFGKIFTSLSFVVFVNFYSNIHTLLYSAVFFVVIVFCGVLFFFSLF